MLERDKEFTRAIDEILKGIDKNIANRKGQSSFEKDDEKNK